MCGKTCQWFIKINLYVKLTKFDENFCLFFIINFCALLKIYKKQAAF